MRRVYQRIGPLDPLVAEGRLPTIERLERCRLIVRCGVGYDKIDGAFARERGIPLAHVLRSGRGFQQSVLG